MSTLVAFCALIVFCKAADLLDVCTFKMNTHFIDGNVDE